MIAKKFRFHGYGALKFVYNKGRMVRSRSLALKFVPNSRRPNSRIAVVVSKKVSKKAPERNRIRRRVYEALRREWDHIQHPHDIVVTVFDEKVATIPAPELEAMIRDLLQQAHLL